MNTIRNYKGKIVTFLYVVAVFIFIGNYSYQTIFTSESDINYTKARVLTRRVESASAQIMGLPYQHQVIDVPQTQSSSVDCENILDPRLPEAVRYHSCYIYVYAMAYGLDPQMVALVMTQESCGRIDAISDSGAYGPMQLMEGAAIDTGVNRYNTIENIKGGVNYLWIIFDHLNLDSTITEHYFIAFAAYNAGPYKELGLEFYRNPTGQAFDYVDSIRKFYNDLNGISDGSYLNDFSNGEYCHQALLSIEGLQITLSN